MKNQFTFLCLIGIILVTVPSCNDEDDTDNTNQECFLSKEFSNNGEDVAEYLYSAENKLEQINYASNDYALFTYSNGKVTKYEEYEDNTLQSYIEYEWNGDQVSVMYFYILDENDEMVLWTTMTVVYTDGKLSQINSEHGSTIMLTNYTWEGDNVSMMSYTLNGSFMGAMTYQYDEKNNTFKAFRGYFFMYGPETLSINNITLATSVDEEGNATGDNQSYTYEYNSNSYPVKRTEVKNEQGEEPETHVTTYEYICR